MTAFAYYNEFDPFAADTLDELIRRGHIAPGFVDRRSILEVRADDLRGFCQAHFFAGVGVWSLAARRAGVPDWWPIWSGSAPCQPWSVAGAGKGEDDERHLWPAWFNNLILECRPDVIFGEQVADASVLGKSVRSAGGGSDGSPRAWFDIISDDLESAHYAVGAVPFTSAVSGAPHIRDRLYWVADRQHDGQREHRDRLGGAAGTGQGDSPERQRVWVDPADGGPTDRLDDPRRAGLEGQRGGHLDAIGYGPGAVRHAATAGGADGVAESNDPQWWPDGAGWHDRDGSNARWPKGAGDAQGRGGVVRVADTDCGPSGQRSPNTGWGHHGSDAQPRARSGGGVGPAGSSPFDSPWGAPDWLWCRDGKWRPVEPGSKPLAYGLARGMGALDAGLAGLANVAGLDGTSLKRAKAYRVGALRAYGNAINAYQAEQFIRSWMRVKGYE